MDMRTNDTDLFDRGHETQVSDRRDENDILNASGNSCTDIEPRDDQRPTKTYRTKKGAVGAQDIPSTNNLAVISLPGYEQALNFKEGTDEKANMVLTNLDLYKTKCDDGCIYIFDENTGKPQKIEIEDYLDNGNIRKVDIPFLVALYSIMLDYQEKHEYEEVGRMSFYVPELLKYIGVTAKASSKRSHQEIIKKVLSFSGLLGVIYEEHNDNRYAKRYPVLSLIESDEWTNTITIESPYLDHIIGTIHKDSARKDKNGAILMTKGGQPKIKASHSYLVYSGIATEKCKAAVMNVFIFAVLIEQTGTSYTPHISARTLLERNVQMKQQIADNSSTSTQNRALKRIFEKTWELMRSMTRVEEKYEGIKIPDLIPTMDTLDTIMFEFPYDKKQEGGSAKQETKPQEK